MTASCTTDSAITFGDRARFKVFYDELEHEGQARKEVKLPANKLLMPGVSTHQTHVTEQPAVVVGRVTRFADLIGRDSVIGTGCGLAQGPFVRRRMHSSIQWAELVSLAEWARIATRRLYGRQDLGESANHA